MKTIQRLIAAALLLVAFTSAIAQSGASAQMDPAGTPEAMSMGAAYLTIANAGDTADHLIGGKTDVASTVEIHEIVDKDGVMTMQPVAGGIEIPAGGSVELKPGGYHVMLIGLTKSLVAGEMYNLTLTFEQAGDVTLMVPIFASEDAANAATPAAPITAGTLTLSKFWSRAAPAMGMEMSGATAAAFMLIENTGAEADRLVGAKTSLASASEIHEMKEGEGGVMEMSPLEGGLEIPAGGSVELKSGGYHVMLIGITEDLTPGMTYELTLTFEKAGDVTITVPVGMTATTITPTAPVTAGNITISGQWTRSAPAMGDDMPMDGAATPTADA